MHYCLGLIGAQLEQQQQLTVTFPKAVAVCSDSLLKQDEKNQIQMVHKPNWNHSSSKENQQGWCYIEIFSLID